MKKNLMSKIAMMLTIFAFSFSFVYGKTFEGTAKGYAGDIVVDAEISENKITDIKIKKSEESGFTKNTINTIIEQIIASQSVDVDDVAGATSTSKGLKAAVADAIKKSGANLEKVSLDGVAGASEERSNETDVVVVGGGGAGITAAIAAHEKGAKVILIEKTPMLGGNTNYATAGLNAADTKVQKKLGIEDNVELFIEDTMKGGKQQNNKELVKVLAKNSSEIVDWLTDRGVDVSEITATGGQSVKRTHRPTGGSAVGPVVISGLSETLKKDKIDVRYSEEVIGIIKDKTRVTGVKVKTANGEYTINAKAVIIATGGFGANPEMVAKYNPNLKGFGTTNSPAITGEGIKMVEAAGGDLVDMTEIQTHPTVLHKKQVMITEAVRGEGAILVNRDGKRFINELETRDVVSKAVLEQKGASAFILFNDSLRNNLKAADGYVKKGFAAEGTLKEITEKIGTNAEELEKTVVDYNEMVNAKNDTEFGRKDMARVLDGEKYYAIEISPAVHHTMGGVRINTNAEVIGKNGKAVRGLYAAGEVTGGVHGANRLGGNAVTDITVFGKIAGENAATFTKAIK